MHDSPIEVDAPENPRMHHTVIGEVPLYTGSASSVIEECRRRLVAREGAHIATANLDFLALARRDAALRQSLNQCDLVVIDGKPVEWLARYRGFTAAERLAGVDLVHELLALGSSHPVRVAMYGSTETISQAAARTFDSYPGVEVALRIVPPFRELSSEERDAERDAIARSDPDIVFVALGCPRQELLIRDYIHAAPGAVWLGIGGTFDFYAGIRKRAPKWMQQSGLEWAARLAQEPRRLWRRYVLRDIPTLLALGYESWRFRSARQTGAQS
jgi:N-acetylglucosaminyldiphosphoundecaprenol N-acetyl-beta-D-mannosaminyltransferase